MALLVTVIMKRTKSPVFDMFIVLNDLIQFLLELYSISNSIQLLLEL